MPKQYAATVERFEELLPDDAAVVRRPMFGHPAAFAHGRMFFGVFGTSLVVRVAPGQLEEALRTPGFAPFEPMPGRPMTGFVRFAGSRDVDDAQARIWIRRALELVRQLPPKPRSAGKSAVTTLPGPHRKRRPGTTER